MALFKKKQRADPEAEKLKSFLDMIAPSLVKFELEIHNFTGVYRTS